MVVGTDDAGLSTAEAVLSVPPYAATNVSASELESGNGAAGGGIGSGTGKWRLDVRADREVAVMSLLQSPTGHLTNLSTVPDFGESGLFTVPLFPAAGDASGREGLPARGEHDRRGGRSAHRGA